ncbi:MAG: MFS transporter [Pseudomonadota bacterium]
MVDVADKPEQGNRAKSGLFAINPTYLAWGVGSLGTVTMISAVSNLYLFFLVGVLKMTPALAGFVIFLSKLVDMVSDPLMGWLSDRTNTRWGRRRPYMLIGSFASAAALLILFTPPLELALVSLETYVLAALVLYALALTMFNVPYLAMPAEMTGDYDERSHLMGYRAVFLVGGGFLGSAAAGPIIKANGGGVEAYAVLGAVFAIAVFLSMLVAVMGTKSAPFTTYQKPRIPVSAQVRLFFLNTPFLRLACAKALQFLQLSAGGATTLFFFIGVMQRDEALLFPFGASVIAGSLASIRLWLPLIRKFGKREVLMAALCMQAVFYLSWLLATPAEPMPLFIARAVLLGAMGGAVLVCSQSMIVDTIEYDRKLSGLSREGLYSSVFSFVEKSMYATGPLIVGIMLSWFGYDPSIPRGQPQPDSARLAIYVGQAWLPALCSLGMVGFLLSYRLTRQDLAQVQRHEIGQQTNLPA